MRVATIAVFAAVAAVASMLVGGLPSTAPQAEAVPTPSVPALPTPMPRLKFVMDPEPVFKRTGGPYITETAARDIASSRAQSPIARQEVRLIPYSSIVRWLGSRTYTLALDREMYLVITSALFVGERGLRGPTTCEAYFSVVDATDGTLWGVGCTGLGAWPKTLPPEFGT